jgi:glutamate racemase
MNIGVFDSGLGGLWILKHLENNLPGYNYVFLGDQAHMPYGNKTPEEITKLCFSITDFLIHKGCTLIVVACNTATSASIESLRMRYPDLVFVGIEPAIKPAGERSKTGHIGVLATKVTAQGKKLHDTIEKFAANIEVHTAIGYGLVELVEEGKADSAEAHALLRTYLDPLLEKNIDQLVLGCTHYAFLIKQIRAIVGENVMIVDPAPGVVRRVEQLLDEHGSIPASLRTPPELFTSGSDPQKMKAFYNSIEVFNN